MKYIVIIIALILFVGCSKSRTELVQNYFEALKTCDTSSLRDCLSQDFVETTDDTILYINDYINLKCKKEKVADYYKVLNINNQDSIILVNYKCYDLLDSAIGVKTLPEYVAKFKIKNDKICQLKIENNNYKEYVTEHGKRLSAILYFFDDKGMLDSTFDKTNYIKFILENINKFNSSDQETKEDYIKTSFLRGIYKCDNCIYKEVEFKGKSTCLILGVYGTSYEIDENYIRVKTDKGDLLFKIIDDKTLEGEGWAEGNYKKVES